MPRKVAKIKEPSTSRETRSKRSLPVSSSSSEDAESENEQTSVRQSEEVSKKNADIVTISDNMVKYLLNYSATKFPIKRADIIKNVNFDPKLYPGVLKSCTETLKLVYGLEVSEISESKSAKVLIVHSAFNSNVTAIQFPREHRHETTLLFIILSYIFMKGGEVHESKFYHYKYKNCFLILINFSSSFTISRAIKHQFARAACSLRRSVKADQGNLHSSTLP